MDQILELEQEDLYPAGRAIDAAEVVEAPVENENDAQPNRISTIPEQERENDAAPVYVYCADEVVSPSEAKSLLEREKSNSQSHVVVKRNSSVEEIDEIDNDSALR